MAESITISSAPPEFKSMQYNLLREEGLKHIQELSGKIWTDYNLSDPGVTILEVLSYAITDLGYRTSFSIKDILAQPASEQSSIKNFFSAKEILPVNPITLLDYRKYLIDTHLYDNANDLNTGVGIRNAWIELATNNELPIYTHLKDKTLGYTSESATDPKQIIPGVLYNVLLEFGTHPTLGDLNVTYLEDEITILPGASLPSFFNGMKIKIRVQFARYSESTIDWSDSESVRGGIKTISLTFPSFPEGYKLQEYTLDIDKLVHIKVIDDSISASVPQEYASLNLQINNFIGSGPGSLIAIYQTKVQKINQLIAEVKVRLMANRNLCEDLIGINALKVEDILLCADIEIMSDADPDQIEAAMYFEIGKFISPAVKFYTLTEMYEKGYRTEEIFEGPLLKHGFIDNSELLKADRRKVIHVSDLISIIMEIPGVLAVKKINIANLPSDSSDNLDSLNVKWNLKLSYEYNYVPRLATSLSKITFFKGPLPYHSDKNIVDNLYQQFVSLEGNPKKTIAFADIEIPKGNFPDLENYRSIQDEFPSVYGIGPGGLPANASKLRQAQAHQLKGFLLMFDQLLAGYLSQLNGVKQLFSMNGEYDNYGNFEINKTYFSQGLQNAVTGFTDLRKAGNTANYEENVQLLTESDDTFYSRRNKFLDHLMARFSEQFTDYAMLVYRISGKKGPKELLTDKLEVLNAYPRISAGRFKAMDYTNQSKVWSVDNVSGFDERVSLLNGIATKSVESLNFSPRFIITGTGPYGFTITDYTVPIPVAIINNTTDSDCETLEEWKLGIEQLILYAINSESRQILDTNNLVITDALSGTAPYKYRIINSGGISIAESVSSYGDYAAALAGLNLAITVFEDEFYNNHEANRNNLSCPIYNYVNQDEITISMDMMPDPPTYTTQFKLYNKAFDFVISRHILTGSFIGQGMCKASVAITAVNASNGTITIESAIPGLSNTGPNNHVTIKNSWVSGSGGSKITNDGNYTVSAGASGTVLTVTGLNSAALTNLGASSIAGRLYYNVQIDSQLLAYAQSKQKADIFEVLLRGKDPENYSLNLSDLFRFNIVDKCNDIIATSTESEFNSGITSRIGATFKLSNADDTIIGTYDTGTVSADEETILIPTDNDLSLVPKAGIYLVFSETLSSVSVVATKRAFNVPGIQNRVLLSGDTFTIDGTNFNNGTYTVKYIEIVSGNSVIYVEESLDEEATTAILDYTKKLNVINITTSGPDYIVHAKFDAGLQAIKECADFITNSFFNTEGLHLVEHILLRPRVNQTVYKTIVNGVNGLIPAPNPGGTVTYTKFYAIESALIETVGESKRYSFYIDGDDMTSEIPLPTATEYPKLIVAGSLNGVNDGTYNILNTSYDLPNTRNKIEVYQTISSATLSGADCGNLYFRKTKSLKTVIDFKTVKTLSEDAAAVSNLYPLEIKTSTPDSNNGTYKIALASNNSGDVDFILSEKITELSDSLLPININDDEDCANKDPYSFIGSVVLPYWQGRFNNNDFRNHMERSIRTECPAHIALNICWVSPTQFEEFENKYKLWLVEKSKETKDSQTHVNALKGLMDAMNVLKSVYETGSIYDCANEGDTKNSLVLNKTII
ncbi:MAG: hypothetical protein IT236_10600 [Bacteroidia bacterium]|nr:hypothetical protein [Bacteroidia bacterium]